MPAVAWRRWSAELLKLGGERGSRGELEKWRSKPGETLEKGGFHGSSLSYLGDFSLMGIIMEICLRNFMGL